MLSQVLPQRQSLEKNAQFRLLLQLQLLCQQLLLRRLLQLLSQLRSQPLHLLKFKHLRQHRNLQLQRLNLHIRCLGMNLRLPELQLRLLTTIRCLTAMMM